MSQKTSILITNADLPTGYGIADEVLIGPLKDHYDQVFCLVKDVDYSGALSAKGAIVIEMKNEVPGWVGGFLKQNNVDAMVLVPDVGNENCVQQARNLVRLAKEAGIKHATMVSLIGVDENLKTCRLLKEIEKEHLSSGIDCCITRHSMYAQWLFLVGPEVRNQMKLSLPWKQDAKCALLNQYDLFRFIAHGLSKNERGEYQMKKGEEYRLTGPTSLSAKDVVDMFNRVLGEKITYEQLDRQRLKEILTRFGYNDFTCEFILDNFELINLGKQQEVSHDNKKQTGQEAKSFDSWLRDNASKFQRSQK